MSDDFMEEEFERDRNRTFRLRDLVELKCPWDVVRAQFPDLTRVELVVLVNEYYEGRLSRWLEVYGEGGKWHTSLKPKWIDEIMPDKEALAEMERVGENEIKQILYDVNRSEIDVSAGGFCASGKQ